MIPNIIATTIRYRPSRIFTISDWQHGTLDNEKL